MPLRLLTWPTEDKLVPCSDSLSCRVILEAWSGASSAMHGNAGKARAPGASGHSQRKKQSSPEMPRAPGGRIKQTARKRIAAPDLAGQEAEVKAATAEPRAATPVRAAEGAAMVKMVKDSRTQNSKAVAVAGESCPHVMRLKS